VSADVAHSDLRRYLDTVAGTSEGFLCAAIGTEPHLSAAGKYKHDQWSEHAFAWPGEAEGAVTEITRAASLGDVYVCPYLMKDSRRAKGNAAQRVLIHADVDTELDEDAVSALGGFVVRSGTPGHGHVYVPLAWPVTPEQHEALCRGLAAHLSGDAKYVDNDLLRPAGTLNYKPTVDGADPNPVVAVWCGNGRVDPRDVAEAIGVDLAHPATTNGTDGRHASIDHGAAPVDLDRYPKVRAALADVTNDRSKDTFRITAVCHRVGLTLAEATWVIRTRDDLAGRLDERGDDDLLAVWLKLDDEARTAMRDDPDDPGPAEPDDADDQEYRGDDEPDETEDTTWEPLDLGPWLAGEITQPKPSVGITRSDGVQFAYPGREHAVLGDTESGKTWFVLGCAAAELAVGHHVLYVHYEEGDPASTLERLLLLGVDPVYLRPGPGQRLRFVAPSRPVRAGWVQALLDPLPTLVVHDGVNEAMSLMGNDIMAAEGAAAFRRQLVTPFLRAGATTIACDHFPKDREGTRTTAYGSVHKGNALDGARIVLENVEPFGRRMRGRSKVYVTKDRPGYLRIHGSSTTVPGKTYMGMLVVDDSESYGPDFAMLFFAPRDADKSADDDPAVGPADIVYDVIAALPDHKVASMDLLYAEIRKAGYQIRDRAVRDAVADLIVDERVTEQPGKRGAKGYRTIPTSALGSET
jgi:hypothetical protein